MIAVVEGMDCENRDPNGDTQDMSTSFCDGPTMKKVIFAISMFFMTTFTPGFRIENPFLRQAFALRGVALPNRKKLLDEHLEQCYY